MFSTPAILLRERLVSGFGYPHETLFLVFGLLLTVQAVLQDHEYMYIHQIKAMAQFSLRNSLKSETKSHSKRKMVR